MEKEYKIYAGIVTYNPDIKRLTENIDAISNQVNRVVLVDNGSKNIEDIEILIDKFDNAIIIKNHRNLGIAKALNDAMNYGYTNSYDWMLTLDQDSVCPLDYVKTMSQMFSVETNIGIVAPVILDRNTGVVGHNPKFQYELVRTCISSGSFVDVEVWKKVGGYDESMFIDSVDFEFCYRVRKNKYKVVQTNCMKLIHEIGKGKICKFLIWKVTVNGHMAFRKYYIARNNIYYPLKHKLFLHFIRGNLRNVWLLISVLLYEEDKTSKIRAILKGWKNAFSKKKQKNEN